MASATITAKLALWAVGSVVLLVVVLAGPVDACSTSTCT